MMDEETKTGFPPLMEAFEDMLAPACTWHADRRE